MSVIVWLECYFSIPACRAGEAVFVQCFTSSPALRAGSIGHCDTWPLTPDNGLVLTGEDFNGIADVQARTLRRRFHALAVRCSPRTCRALDRLVGRIEFIVLPYR